MIFTGIKKGSHLFFYLIRVFLFIEIFCVTLHVPAQQISIPRVDAMPSQPSPYEMRDWEQVAKGYDSLVFDPDLNGQYLPLIWVEPSGMNYPNHSWFGLHTAVGTYSPQNAEAINILPAVIGASLVGIDKSDQNGKNWVLMCEEFFNNRPEENVYLNHPVAVSGTDWWYDTMPNVFFYQLYSLYPNTGDFAYQFRKVADRWLEALKAMGGGTTPWRRPNMNYRAWSLSTMEPLMTGVREPEAAGAIAWIQYLAFIETGDPIFRIGAEWAMEFLDNLTQNPSYELQLPYGVLAAARMNAELGTMYDIEKMLNWCFDSEDNVRYWGVTLGNWGGYDCYGLVGEAEFEGYAFAMNTFEQVGALVPMVRYDDRFARAMGKWVLNAANAARLFYSKYLPHTHQDNETWSEQYDPESFIAYEALREVGLGSNKRPYATGDFQRSGWGATNLSLYGSSHVGILGGIIDTTHVPMILRIDVTKTDFFQKEKYPSYLYFNPHHEAKTVEIELGSDLSDIYNAVSNTFIAMGASGSVSFDIPADEAVLLVLTPAGGDIDYDLHRMRIDGVVVDYRSGQPVDNYPPRIKSLASETMPVIAGQEVEIYCTANDRDGDPITFQWESSGGFVSGSGSQVTWTAPDSTGQFTLSCTVTDGNGGKDSAHINIETVAFMNQAPRIDSLRAYPRRVHLEGMSEIRCYATDPDGDSLSFAWSARMGNLEADDSLASWTAPSDQGYYYIRCTVSDNRGGASTDSVGIAVTDTADVSTGMPIAYFPFSGNANDESGFDHHGIVRGASPAEDRFGNPDRAYYFNGSFDYIEVLNAADLNFQEAVSVCLWMKPEELFENRESYPISHGSWENRWKISIIPNGKVRWTVKTDQGVMDLDSQTLLQEEVYVHAAGVYDGSNFDIYINGALDNHTAHSGKILTTSIDLTIGQVLPNNQGYNFKGILDDIRIYNYALTAQEIFNVYQDQTSNVGMNETNTIKETCLYPNYPNPFNASTTIQYQLKHEGHVRIVIYNVVGQLILTLADEKQAAGLHSIQWDGKGRHGYPVPSGIYFYRIHFGDFEQNRKLLILE